MLDIIIYLALFGSIVAGLWDLRTTEVPDEIPVLMSAIGVLYWLFISLTSGEYLNLIISITSGTFLLIFGMLLYYKGQWGGADALILAAIAYMIPFHNGEIFIFSYLPNLFIVGSAYMILYSVILGFMNPNTFKYFVSDVIKNIKYVLGIPSVFGAFILFSQYKFGRIPDNSLFMMILVSGLVLFWRYAVIVEQKIFRKRIPVSKLKEGDVLDNMIWRGLSHSEVKKLIKNKKYVIIKEGVRFIPAFPLALIVTVLFGNLLQYLI